MEPIRTIVAALLVCGVFLKLFLLLVCERGGLKVAFIIDATPIVLTTAILANGLVKAGLGLRAIP
jgi:hypothetical protein